MALFHRLKWRTPLTAITKISAPELGLYPAITILSLKMILATEDAFRNADTMVSSISLIQTLVEAWGPKNLRRFSFRPTSKTTAELQE